MHAEEWERIKSIFEAALTVADEGRSAYLDSVCGGDAAIRSTVDQLLSHHFQAGRFLESVSVRIHHVFSHGDLVASRFRIIRFIGSGGMGEVYEVFDERLRVRVALKTLHPELALDRQSLDRFQREIRVAREVSHQNLCKIFDLVEHGGSAGGIVPCLTMQLVEGESLLTYLNRERPLTPELALPLIRQIAGAIEALHEHHIVHRDLKPSNVMLTTRNDQLRAIVTDFGLAKTLDQDAEFFESQVDFQAGAPYFMAPELLRGNRPNAASDIYAFGLIVDEMLTRSRAFSAESVQALYYQKLWETPIPPRSRSANLPQHWEKAIFGCLRTKPEERYSSIGAVVRDLETPAVEAPPAPVDPVAVKRPKRFSLPVRRRTLAAVIFALLALLSVTAFSRLLTKPLNTSIMVFPIENVTSHPEYDYLCKGTDAEVMRRLMLIDGVRVIPYYQPRAKASGDLVKTRFSLEGFLQVFNGRVRLTASLTDNQSGVLVWTQNFDRELHDPLALQSDIAEGSVRALEARSFLGGSERIATGIRVAGPIRGLFPLPQVTVPRPATNSSAAFDSYIRGRALLEERTFPAALNAIRCFEDALTEDPTFALAKAALADSQFGLMDYDYAPAKDLVARGREYAEQAVKLGPDIAETYASLAAVQQTDWDFNGAEQSYRKAIQLNPKLSRAHRWYAGLILQFGRTGEAIEETRLAMDLDPYDYPGKVADGLYFFLARRYQEAKYLLEGLIRQKDLSSAHVTLGDVYLELAAQSSGAEKTLWLRKALEQADLVEHAMRQAVTEAPLPSSPVSIKFADRMHAQYYTLAGDSRAAQPYIERMASDASSGRTSKVPLAIVYTMTGEQEQALDLLEQAATQKDRQLLYLRVLPQFDRIRNTKRFDSILRKMAL
jgi:eukaryotic-like serine/threonine-protein kinase